MVIAFSGCASGTEINPIPGRATNLQGAIIILIGGLSRPELSLPRWLMIPVAWRDLEQ
jgi:hypothetical protein